MALYSVLTVISSADIELIKLYPWNIGEALRRLPSYWIPVMVMAVTWLRTFRSSAARYAMAMFDASTVAIMSS